MQTVFISAKLSKQTKNQYFEGSNKMFGDGWHLEAQEFFTLNLICLPE